MNGRVFLQMMAAALLWAASFAVVPDSHADQIISAVESVACQLALQQAPSLAPAQIARVEKLRQRALSIAKSKSASDAVSRYFDRLINPESDEPEVTSKLGQWIVHLQTAISGFKPNSSLIASQFNWSPDEIVSRQEFAAKTLGRLKDYARPGKKFSNSTFVPLAVDYLAALSAMKSSESEAWATAAAFAQPSKYEDYAGLANVLGAYPFIQLHLGESDPFIAGFVETLLVPAFHIGIAHGLVLYDGAPLHRTTGDGQAPYEYGYRHDFLNHFFKQLRSFGPFVLERYQLDLRVPAAEEFDIDEFLDHLEDRIQRFEIFYRTVDEKLNIPVARQALLLVIFEIIHEIGDVSELSSSSIAAALQELRMPAVPKSPVRRLAERLITPYDVGLDPSLQDLAALAHQDIDRAVSAISNAVDFLITNTASW